MVLGFVVWEISGHFGGVYQSRYCASDGAFLFSFVYVMYYILVLVCMESKLSQSWVIRCVYE